MNSKDYWAEREAEALKHYIKDEKEYDKQIEKIYSDMLDSCNEQINAFYGKYAATEGITIAEAKKRVSALDIAAYERKAKRYVKEKDFSDKANEEMRLYNATMKINRLEMLKANIGLEMIAGHNELEKFMGEILKGRTEEELKRQAGILGKTVKTNSKKAHAIPNASFHNATFSDRIWLYQDLMKAELSKLLQSGLIQGKNPRVLARELKKQFDVKTADAERLMRTELARVQTEAQKQSYERNGFEEYIFLANSSCCEVCQALHDKHFKVADMMPGENASPIHPHCRCSTAPYSGRKEYDEWLEHLANGGTTAEFEELKAKGIKIPTVPQKAEKQPQKADLSSVTTFEQLAEYFNNNYNVTIDNAVKSLDFESVKEGLQGVEIVMREFPQAKSSLHKIGVRKDGIMNAGYEGDINFNPFYYTDRKVAVKASQSTGYHPKGNNTVSTGSHEAGHILEKALIDKDGGSAFGVIAWSECMYAKSVVKDAQKAAKKTPEGKGKRNYDLMHEISGYANTNASECLAEAVADYTLNGENAAILSREIWKILKGELG